MTWRRYLVYGVIGAALVGAVAASHDAGRNRSASARAGGPGGRFRGGNSDQPVPTLATAARTANMPVYLDGVGTMRALNTVTVQIAGRRQAASAEFPRRPGRRARRTNSPRSIPTIYQAQYDQAVAKKAQDEALLANAQRDLERYARLAATNALPPQQADTQTLAGRAIRSAGEGRSGRDRQRARHARIHHHRRADLRPHRHAAGRYRQHRACVRCDRPSRHHAAAADLGDLHACRSSSCCRSTRRLRSAR